MNRAILSLCFLFYSAEAMAADWFELGANRTGSDVYVDLSSIKEKGSGYSMYRTAWIKIDHSRDNTVRERETKTLYHFRCESEEWKWVQMVTYNADGTMADSSTAPSYLSFKAAVPDTVGYAIMEFVCGWPINSE